MFSNILTSFLRMLAGMPNLNISYKPQQISPKWPGTVRQLLHSKIPCAYLHPQFDSEIMKPLKIEDIIDHEVKVLSGGELQRVALALTLGKVADVYLIDEASAYLDSEQRIIVAQMIKRFILNHKRQHLWLNMIL